MIRSYLPRWKFTDSCGAVGARIVVLEGLMGSGKSMLTKQSFALGAQQSSGIFPVCLVYCLQGAGLRPRCRPVMK
jgi:hypothetical protein